jgi:16S rRNA processing protein RimM
MLKDDIISAGKLGKPVGREGSIKIDIDPHFEKLLKKLKFLFVCVDGNFVPFRLSGCQLGQSFSVTFTDLNSPEEVSWMTNKLFGIHRSEIPVGFRSHSKTNVDITGYEVWDNKVSIGVITNVIKNPGQTLLEVSSPNHKIILIPYVDAFITDVDKSLRIIRMELPEGLLNL